MIESAITVIAGVFAIVVALYLTYFIFSKSEGNEKMKELSESVHTGAMAFLKEEYKLMVIFIVGVIVALFLASWYTDLPWETAFSFLVGSIFSALTGNIGMRIATKANARTAEGVKKSFGHGLRIAFSSGAVMGLFVVGLGVWCAKRAVCPAMDPLSQFSKRRITPN